MKKDYIRLWAEDFNLETWYDYCEIVGVPHESEWIKIYFMPGDVESGKEIK